MKSKYLGLLVVGLFSTGVLAPLAANAAASVPGSGDAPFVTNGDIKFKEATGPVDPKDPTDPTKPDPKDPDNPGTGQTGKLTLDSVPALHFGEHEVGESTLFTLSPTKKDAANKDVAVIPFIQASDRRGVNDEGKAIGWNVTVLRSEFKNGTKELAGSELNFKATTDIKAADSENTSGKPETAAITVGETATKVFGADPEKGLGTWLAVYKPEDISLKVPTSVQGEGTYTADLTWAINEAPVK